MKKLIILFAILSVFISCDEDFLSVNDPNSLTPANFPASGGDMEQILQGVYSSMHAYGLYGHTMGPKTVFCWDHTQDMAWQGTQTWINLCQNDTVPSDGFIEDTWRDSYKGIQRANTILEFVTEFREDNTVGLTPEELDLYEGQAYFLRSWFYFNLIAIWGEDFIIDGQGGDAAGVPIITEVATSNEVTNVPRSSVGEVWNFIIDDLTKANALLNGATWSGTDIYKIDTWAVKAFLGKVYAYTDDWTSARPLLQDVIANSGKSLVPFDIYKDMFNGTNEFNNESLIEIPLTNDISGDDNDESTTGSWIPMIMAPSHNSSPDGGTPVGAGWSNTFPHEKNLSRFGYTIDHYFDAGVTEAHSDNVRDGYVDEVLQARADKSYDPRLWVSTLQPYVDSLLVGGIPTAISHYHDGVEVERQAWSFRKYINLEARQRNIGNGGSNIYILRMAEVYLLYAEALIETGDPIQGLEYLNKVKRRAYDYPIDSPSPVDYISLTDQTSANDPVLANDPLKYERFAELFGEGKKWYDTRRWKIGAEEAAYYESVRGGSINWQETDYAQPIPTLEIENNPAIDFSNQNPGY